jgi:acyl-CoA synthetase
MYLDPDFPLLKQEEVVKRSKASVIISDSSKAFSGWKLTTRVRVFGANELHIFQECLPSSLVNFPLPEEWNIAYLIHTSGSTGTPKVVRVPHTCLLPNILDLR